MTELMVAALGISIIAAFAQATTGFGYSLVSIPLLAVASDPVTAVVAATIVSGTLSAVVATRERDEVNVPLATGFTIAGIVGMPFGLLVLATLSERFLTVTIGVVLLIAVVLTARNFRLPATRWFRLSAGVLSGVLLTSTGMSGPPAVLALDTLNLDVRRFRATLQAIFCVQGVVAIAAFIVLGRVDRATLLVVVASLIGLPPGWTIGQRVFGRLSARQFHHGVLVMLALTAVVAIFDAFAP